MFGYIWPVALIVISNSVYQICAKGIPKQMNTYASMTVTYAVATLVSAITFFISTKGSNIFKEFSLTNWATVALGVVITGLEIGFSLQKWLESKYPCNSDKRFLGNFTFVAWIFYVQGTN